MSVFFCIRTHSMELIYQYCVETSADPSEEMILRQRSRVIPQTYT